MQYTGWNPKKYRSPLKSCRMNIIDTIAHIHMCLHTSTLSGFTCGQTFPIARNSFVIFGPRPLFICLLPASVAIVWVWVSMDICFSSSIGGSHFFLRPSSLFFCCCCCCCYWHGGCSYGPFVLSADIWYCHFAHCLFSFRITIEHIPYTHIYVYTCELLVEHCVLCRRRERTAAVTIASGNSKYTRA